MARLINALRRTKRTRLKFPEDHPIVTHLLTTIDRE